jgi:hypothetical protein
MERQPLNRRGKPSSVPPKVVIHVDPEMRGGATWTYVARALRNQHGSRVCVASAVGLTPTDALENLLAAAEDRQALETYGTVSSSAKAAPGRKAVA